MRPYATFAAILVSLFVGEESRPDERPTFDFEITPVAAYRFGGSFDGADGTIRVELNDSSAQGLVFNVRANPNGQYELLYARQSTDASTRGILPDDPDVDIKVDHLQFGGTYLFDGVFTRPFVALTLGATRFDPGITGTSSESFFSASLGAGVHLNASKRVGLRLEARVFTTFVDDDSKLFCASVDGAGACLFQLEARTLSQWEARAGLVFRF